MINMDVVPHLDMTEIEHGAAHGEPHAHPVKVITNEAKVILAEGTAPYGLHRHGLRYLHTGEGWVIVAPW